MNQQQRKIFRPPHRQLGNPTVFYRLRGKGLVKAEYRDPLIPNSLTFPKFKCSRTGYVWSVERSRWMDPHSKSRDRHSSEDHPGVVGHLSPLRCITPTGWGNRAFERGSEDDGSRSSTTRLFHQCILFFFCSKVNAGKTSSIRRIAPRKAQNT